MHFRQKFLIHFHKELEHCKYETVDRLVPVIFTVPVVRREHDGQIGGRIVTDQTHSKLHCSSRGPLPPPGVGLDTHLCEVLSEQGAPRLSGTPQAYHVEDLL